MSNQTEQKNMKIKTKVESSFVLTSKKLRHYLGAISFAYDDKLENPNELRRVFNLLYPKRYSVLKELPYKNSLNIKDIGLVIPDDHLIIDPSERSQHGLGSLAEDEEFYVFIWKEGDIFMWAKPHVWGYYDDYRTHESWVIGWRINEEDTSRPIDCIKLVQQYNKVIIKMCEIWGY